MSRMSTRLALAAAVSAVALTGGAALAQQNQQGQQRQQQQQQMQRQSQQSQQSPNEYQQVRGSIVDYKRVNVRGSQRPATLVLLETEQGNRAVVDLGTERIGIRLQQGAELAVRGRPVNVGDRKVILQANAISYEGRAYDVNRPARQRQAMQDGSGQQQRQNMNRQGGQNQQQSGNRQSRQQQSGQQQGNRQQNANLRLGPYDNNDDARFNVRELTQALYGQFDRDDNGTLSVAEWDRGMDRYFGEADINLDASAWDRDDNDRISRNEFRRGLRTSGLYEELDADGNGSVNRSELSEYGIGSGSRQAGMNRSAFNDRIGDTDLYANLDEDGNDEVSYGEMSTGLFSAWDADDNDELSRSEYREYGNGWFGDEEGLFQDWDDDGSGSLTEDEFGTGVESAGVYETYDEDDSGWFSEDELYGATYTASDDNEDGLIGDSEWSDSAGVWEDEGLL